MLKSSYRFAKKLYQKGNFKLAEQLIASLEKSAQQVFQLDYDGFTGRKMLNVDPATYKHGRTPGCGSVVTDYGKTITIRDSKIMNLQAWQQALQAAGGGIQRRQRGRGGMGGGEAMTAPRGGCNHEWADTGMRWTFCKKCDQEGYNDMGHIKPVQKSAALHVASLQSEEYRQFIFLKNAYKAHKAKMAAKKDKKKDKKDKKKDKKKGKLPPWLMKKKK